MKAFALAATFAIALAPFGVSVAAQSESAIQDCFAKHAQLMDKPTLKNPRDCWQTHRHLT